MTAPNSAAKRTGVTTLFQLALMARSSVPLMTLAMVMMMEVTMQVRLCT